MRRKRVMAMVLGVVFMMGAVLPVSAAEAGAGRVVQTDVKVAEDSARSEERRY